MSMAQAWHSGWVSICNLRLYFFLHDLEKKPPSLLTSFRNYHVNLRKEIGLLIMKSWSKIRVYMFINYRLYC
jgi:hypothetical protein